MLRPFVIRDVDLRRDDSLYMTLEAKVGPWSASFELQGGGNISTLRRDLGGFYLGKTVMLEQGPGYEVQGLWVQGTPEDRVYCNSLGDDL